VNKPAKLKKNEWYNARRLENARTRLSGNFPVANHNARHLPIRVSESADDYPSSQWRKRRRREISALFASWSEAQRTSGERGSVLSLVARLSIFLAFSASRNISPVLTLLLSRECYTFSRSIGGVLHLAFTFMIVSAVWPSLVHETFGHFAIAKKDKTNLEFETKISNIILRLHKMF